MTPKSYKIIFWILLVLVIVVSYGNQLMYRYVVPPGYDGIVHAQIIQSIMDGNHLQIVSYHSLSHLLTIPFVFLLKLSPITTLAWVNPALLVTMAASLAFFAKKAFGPLAGITALVLMAFFSLQPMQTLIDGGYPNVLAAGTLLPLFFLVIHQIASTKLRWWYIPALILGFMILIWSHHLTTLYALPIASMYIIVMLARNLLEKKVSFWLIAGTLVLLAAGVIGGTWWLLHSGPDLSVTRLADQFVRTDTKWPYFHLISSLYSPDAILPLGVYPRDIGYVIVFGGTLACIWGIWRAFATPKHPTSRYYMLLIIWTVVLFIGSRMESLGFPVRLARDMAIPLTLLCAGALAELITAIQTKLKYPATIAALAIVALGILYVGRNTLWFRYHLITDPNAQVHHLDVDSQAADYITQNLPTTAKIGLFQESLYVDVFTPQHSIIWITDAQERKDLLELTQPEKTLARYDYLYLEHRTNKNTPDDNEELLAYYLNSPLVSQMTTFTQPEKVVYLLKINQTIVSQQLATNPQIAGSE